MGSTCMLPQHWILTAITRTDRSATLCGTHAPTGGCCRGPAPHSSMCTARWPGPRPRLLQQRAQAGRQFSCAGTGLLWSACSHGRARLGSEEAGQWVMVTAIKPSCSSLAETWRMGKLGPCTFSSCRILLVGLLWPPEQAAATSSAATCLLWQARIAPEPTAEAPCMVVPQTQRGGAKSSWRMESLAWRASPHWVLHYASCSQDGDVNLVDSCSHQVLRSWAWAELFPELEDKAPKAASIKLCWTRSGGKLAVSAGGMTSMISLEEPDVSQTRGVKVAAI